jgi:hypothetical protein
MDANNECVITGSCAQPILQGEYKVNYSIGGPGDAAFEHGRIEMPLIPATDSTDGTICFELPLGRLVASAGAEGYFSGAEYEDIENLKFQLSAWTADSAEQACDPNDFIATDDTGTAPKGCNNVVDVIPNAGFADTAAVDVDGNMPGTDAYYSDIDGSTKVDLDDLGILAAGFGARNIPKCPK